MQTQNQSERGSAKAEDLTPTPTQEENDNAMRAAQGEPIPENGGKAGDHKPAAPAHHEPERRVPAR